MREIRLTAILFVSFLVIAASGSVFAEVDTLDNLKQMAAGRVEQEVDEGSDEALDEAFEENGESEEPDASEETKAKKKEAGKEMKATSPVKPSKTAAPQSKPKLESYTRYDFVPGDQILLFEDFSQTAIGDFPALWTSNSSGEVRTVNIADGRWFHLSGEDAVYCYSKPIKFPENFIVEFDIIPDAQYADGITLSLYQDDPENSKELNDDLYPGLRGLHITLKQDGWETKGYETDKDWLNGNASTNPVTLESANHVIVWIQKRRVRIYHRGSKVLDVPTNIYTGTAFNRLRFSGYDAKSHPMITALKITTAAPDLRSKLLTEGKIISYGIYFDSGKDVVKPESYGSLQEIAAILRENPDLKIAVVGHTDSDGEDVLNLSLSKRRAENVKNALAKDFGIAVDRIQADGKGESAPLAPNSNVEGKAKNRRVEFIKM